MSLNNSQMLPARVRNMRQMNDVLNAEDIILAEIERIIDEMYQRASLLHEELINEEWLENKLSERTGAGVDVTGYAEKLLAEIVLDVSELLHWCWHTSEEIADTHRRLQDIAAFKAKLHKC